MVSPYSRPTVTFVSILSLKHDVAIEAVWIYKSRSRQRLEIHSNCRPGAQEEQTTSTAAFKLASLIKQHQVKIAMPDLAPINHVQETSLQHWRHADSWSNVSRQDKPRCRDGDRKSRSRGGVTDRSVNQEVADRCSGRALSQLLVMTQQESVMRQAWAGRPRWNKTPELRRTMIAFIYNQ